MSNKRQELGEVISANVDNYINLLEKIMPGSRLDALRLMAKKILEAQEKLVERQKELVEQVRTFSKMIEAYASSLEEGGKVQDVENEDVRKAGL